jgi:uncharacterized membrane protein YdbT with pleckstrin-like domain
MFNQKETYKLPPAANMYVVAKVILMVTLISLIFFFSKIWFSMWTFLVIFFGLPIGIFVLLRSIRTSFSIDGNKIAMNWGIITRNSRTVLIENVQNVNVETGLLMRIFGVSVLRFWTASQSQIVIDKNGASTKPDGLLVLASEDAQWLNEYIANNGQA